MMHEDANQDAGAVDAEFRSLSVPAALSFALGLASPAALASPLLVIIPVAATLLALLALAKIRASGGELTGAGLARWGLALGLACLAAAAVRGPVRNALLRRQAQAAARQWLTLVAEERYVDALDLMTGAAVQTLGPKGGSPDAPPPPADEVRTIVLANFRNDKTAAKIREYKPPLTVAAAPVSNEWPVFDGGRTLLSEDFAVSSSTKSEPSRVGIRLVRTTGFEAEGRPWRVDSWQLQEPSAAAADEDSL